MVGKTAADWCCVLVCVFVCVCVRACWKWQGNEPNEEKVIEEFGSDICTAFLSNVGW